MVIRLHKRGKSHRYFSGAGGNEQENALRQAC